MDVLCKVCGERANGGESRSCCIAFDVLGISPRGMSYDNYQADEDATVCGQGCALILTERFLERGTFEPAEDLPSAAAPAPAADTFAALT